LWFLSLKDNTKTGNCIAQTKCSQVVAAVMADICLPESDKKLKKQELRIVFYAN